MITKACYELRLVLANRDKHRIVIGIDVYLDSEQFQYFECWASRIGDVPFGDRQKLVAAAVKAVGDRLVGQIQPLADPGEAIIVPIESHPTGEVLGSMIAAALLDLAVLERDSFQPLTIHTIELPNRPVLPPPPRW